MSPAAARLADIAAAAGVSVPTVSKVLNGRSDVSVATRGRVLDVARAMGYSRGAEPRGRPALRGRPFVDLVLGGAGAWSREIAAGVESAASAAGIDVVINVDRADAGESWAQRLLRRGSRGAILALTRPTTAEFARLAHAGVAVVMLEPTSGPPPGIASVGATNRRGGADAAAHLLARGHGRLLLLRGEPQYLFGLARVAGFRAAVAAQPDAVLTEAAVGWDSESSRRAALGLLGGPDAPTAVFCCTDAMAMGVLAAARELGLSVPGRLAVIGFDDVPELGWSSPALTTVRQPLRAMAEGAVRILDGLLAGAPPPATAVELPTRLVIREST